MICTKCRQEPRLPGQRCAWVPIWRETGRVILLGCVAAVAIAFVLAVPGLIGYAVFHFVLKSWLP